MPNRKITFSQFLLLIIGFFSLTIAITTAYLNPATRYEMSIYQNTPLAFWSGIISSLIISVSVTFTSRNTQTQTAAVSLGALSMLSVVLLPVIRNYYFVGEGDALSHLGIALDINSGTRSILDLLYPLAHTLSVILYRVSGIEIRRGLVILLAIFVVVFIIFIPLIARLFSNTPSMIHAAFFSSLLLLPLNHFTGHMHPHTTSYSIFYLPLMIYLFILVMMSDKRRYNILIVIGMVGIILLHPQQAANIIILFGVISVSQLAISQIKHRQSISSHVGSVYSHVSIMAVIFWLWTEGLEIIANNLQRPIANFIARSERQTGGNVRSAVPSLETAGGSVEEIFIKLFLLGVIYCIISLLIMAGSLSDIINDKHEYIHKYGKRVAFSDSSSNLVVLYLTIGFAAIVGLFFIYIVGDQSRQYFRHHSFMMVMITVFGSISLGQLLKSFNENNRIITAVIVAIFIVFLLISLPVVHVSPYIYQESEHVPQSQVEGYETAFKHQEEGVPFTYIRSSTSRYHDAIIGERSTTSFVTAEPTSPPVRFSEQGSLRLHYQEETYLAVTSRDQTRDRNLHEGIRYNSEDYNQFNEEPGIDQIQDNGGFMLYRITPL